MPSLFARFTLVLLLVTAPVFGSDLPWWENYVPGQFMSREDYAKKLEDLGLWEKAPRTTTAFADYFSAVDKESLGALYKIFSGLADGETQVWYGSYTPENGPAGEDGNRGLRILAKRSVKDANGEKRLITLITFWKYIDGELVLTTGNDALRLRVQIGPGVKTKEWTTEGNFLGIAYTLVADQKGKISDFYPTDWRKIPSNTAIVPLAGNHGCFFCHMNERRELRSNFPLKRGRYRVVQYPHGPNLDKVKPGDEVEYLPGDELSPWKSDLVFDTRENIVDESLLNIPAKNRTLMNMIYRTPAPAQSAFILSVKNPKATLLKTGLLEAIIRRCEGEKR